MSELYNKEMLVGTFLDLCPFGTTVTAGSGTDTVDERMMSLILSRAMEVISLSRQ